MKYRFKLIGRFMKNIFVNAKPVWIIELVGLLVCALEITDGGLNHSGAALLVTMIAMPVMILAAGIANAFRTAPYMEIFEEKGFCREYLEAFERVWIYKRNKTPNLQLVQQAEIYLFLGDTATCAALLSRIRVPESEELARAWYLITYMRMAVTAKDASLAADIWNKNYNFINRYIAKTINTAFNSAAIELNCCYVKMLCLQGEYTAALEAIGRAMPKNRKKGPIADLYILQTYIYHQLGSPLERQSMQDAQNAIVGGDYELEISRRHVFDSLDKATRGEMAIW